ncbi:MAG: FecR domain-containing protein [Burkholderiales bacterium]|nr:FecR domain-containing protein [Burkholderiales bacterium]
MFRYQTQPGDTLIGLGEALLIHPGDWPKLTTLNRISDVRHIPVGSVIRIPLALLRSHPRPGQLVAVVGQASLAKPGTPAVAAAVGADVAPGTTITTDPTAYVTVRLADGSELRLQPSTTVQLESSEHYEAPGFFASTLRVLQGRVEALVTHMTGGEPRFKVKTPQTVLGVRGTEFRIATDGAHGQTRAEVLTGLVAVGEGRRPTLLDSGFATQADGAGHIATKVPLLPAPDLSSLPALYERLVVRADLHPVPGAARYWGQVSRDRFFSMVQAEASSSTPELRWANLPDGNYVLRVRVADANGIEGRDAIHHFKLKARPEPPMASWPTPRGIVQGTAAKLAWAQQTEAASYHVQVARDPEFKELLRDEASVKVASFSADLLPGAYFWRLASVRPDGDQGPFGDPQSFVLRPLPPQPGPPKIDERHIRFSWAGEPGQTFEFQMARDEGFASVVLAQRLNTPVIELDKPSEGGRYFIRYRAIDADGFVGAYTSAQFFDLPRCVADGRGQCVHAGAGGLLINP